MYLADSLNADSKIGVSTARSIDELEAMVSSYEPGSAERTYLTTLRLAATGFARGIERRKRLLNVRLAA